MRKMANIPLAETKSSKKEPNLPKYHCNLVFDAKIPPCSTFLHDDTREPCLMENSKYFV
jgi:hypothetical protein